MIVKLVPLCLPRETSSLIWKLTSKRNVWVTKCFSCPMFCHWLSDLLPRGEWNESLLLFLASRCMFWMFLMRYMDRVFGMSTFQCEGSDFLKSHLTLFFSFSSFEWWDRFPRVIFNKVEKLWANTLNIFPVSELFSGNWRWNLKQHSQLLGWARRLCYRFPWRWQQCLASAGTWASLALCSWSRTEDMVGEAAPCDVTWWPRADYGSPSLWFVHMPWFFFRNAASSGGWGLCLGQACYPLSLSLFFRCFIGWANCW